MKTYAHNKTELAKLIAKNDSKRTNECVFVFTNGIKSIPTMKFCDTTVTQVCGHHELPNINGNTGMIINVFHKGRERKVF